ncbi:TPA: SH3 domain-containing protein [Streptococcus suis]
MKPTDNAGLAISAILELGAISPSSLPASGSYTIQSYSSVRNNPSLSSPEITFYGAGSVVRYDKVITAEGRTWISYISYSGARRYIAIS